MKHIQVVFKGSLGSITNYSKVIDIEVPSDTNLVGLLEILKLNRGLIGVAICNEQILSDHEILKDNCIVIMYEVFGGG